MAKIHYEKATVEISQGMIEAVMTEFETENPGKSALEMDPSEFSRRMMTKVNITVDPQ